MKQFVHISLVAVLGVAPLVLAQTEGPITQEGRYWVRTISGIVTPITLERFRLDTIGNVVVRGSNGDKATFQLKARVRAKDAREAEAMFREFDATPRFQGGWFRMKITAPTQTAEAPELVMFVPRSLQQVLIEDDAHRERSEAEHNPFRMWRYVNADLKQLLVADILVRFCEQIPYAFVVIWAVGTADAPGPVSALQFGVLRTIEMATAVAIYIPVAYFADRSHKKPFVVMTFVFFTLFPLLLLYSKSFGMLSAAFVLRGMKEFGEPTRKALIMDLAPEDRKAGVFGLYYLIRDTVVSIAAFGGAFLWRSSPRLNLLSAFAFGALGTIWFAVRGRDLGRTQAGGS